MGLLYALGSLFPNDDNTPNGLQRFGSALDPEDMFTQQKTQATQMQNQQQQGALQALGQLRQQGVTNPQQIVSALAQYDPDVAVKAASLQAQNPLASLLSGANSSPNAGTAESLTGDELLKSLPPGVAAQVKGYAEGKIPFTPYTLRSAAGQQMLQLVNQYDPSFDAVNYGSRASTRKDFTSGKAAQNITALNTAIGHISTLQDASKELDNTEYPTVNGIVNTVKNLTGSDKVKNFETAKDAVADELTRVFRGTGGSVADIDAWKSKLSAANSPQQFKGVMGQMTELLNSRLDALGQQYNQGMGTTKDGIELLSPKAQSAYAKITGEAPAKTAVSGDMQSDNAPQAAPQGSIKEGTTATNPKTKAQIIFRGGKWQPL